MKSSFAWLVVFGIGIFAARAQAQQPQLPPKSYMSKNVFYLPVKIDDKVRSTLREVQLYGKDNPNKPWVLMERATPSQTYFTFRAPHDGEYWFTVVVVDKSGKPIPGDLRREGPGLIVVLDTQLPQVDVQTLSSSPADGTIIRCTVNDANPDLTKTRFYYQSGDMAWRPLSPMPNQMDQYCIPPQAVFTGMVKVEACDLAKNTVNREFNVGTSQVSEQTQDPAVKTAGFTSNTEKGPMVKTLPMPSEGMANKAPGPFPVDQVIGPDIEPPLATKAAKNNSVLVPAEARMPQGMKTEIELEKSPVLNAAPVCTSAKSCFLSKHLVNKTHVFLQYQIDNVGSSGVGKIEVWMTPDKGQTWQKLAEVHKQPNPIEVDLPGEGLFGVKLVVSNGRGFGATPPANGEQPDWWIEVDTTKPVAELRGLRMGTGTDGGCVFITWSVQDKNLAGEPIDLYFALCREGPWQPIAQNLKNDGQFSWHMPAYVGTEAFVRLIAHDAAGNSTIADCAQPVPLDDMSRPRGRLSGVSTTAPVMMNENGTAQTVDSRK
jgi:hypothetical protein